MWKYRRAKKEKNTEIKSIDHVLIQTKDTHWLNDDGILQGAYEGSDQMLVRAKKG